eukprot:3041434-Pyramimonas_sp.AAC.1
MIWYTSNHADSACSRNWPQASAKSPGRLRSARACPPTLSHCSTQDCRRQPAGRTRGNASGTSTFLTRDGSFAACSASTTGRCGQTGDPDSTSTSSTSSP